MDVWIRTQSVAVASGRAANLIPHPPINHPSFWLPFRQGLRIRITLNADPDLDQAFHFNADPDQIFSLFNEDPDPAPHRSDANNADPCGSESATHTVSPPTKLPDL
jgi:hypothetical protein